MKTITKALTFILISAFIINSINVLADNSLEWPATYGERGLDNPFAPTDKYVCEQNSPDFSWPYISSATSYEIIVCSDYELKDVKYTKSDIKINFYNFEYPFEIGTYYWAVRYHVGKVASSWSTARRFRIDPDASVFTVPSVEELLNRVPLSHPRIWTTQTNLENFRSLSNSGVFKSVIEQATKRVRTAMQELLPQEPKLAQTTDKVALSRAKLQLVADANKLMNIMMDAAFVYLVTQDKEIGNYAVNALAELSKWDPNGDTSYKSQDQVHRQIALDAAMAYDWIYDLLTDEQRKSVLDMIRERTLTMAYLLDALLKSPYDSHGFTAYGYIGIIAIATYGEIPESEEWITKAVPVYSNIMPPWSDEDGGWSQGTDYWQYSSTSNKEFADVLKNAGIINLYDKAYSKNEINFPVYMFPKGSTGAFGDQSSYRSPTFYHSEILGTIASEYKAPVAKWLQEEISPIDPAKIKTYLLENIENVEKNPPQAWPRAKEFKDIGWAAMHSDLMDPNRVSLFFKSSPYGSYNHSHADQNSFVIQAYGKRLAIDSGYYDAYHSAFDSGYTRKTYAHNAVTIDGGIGQPDDNFNGKGKLLNFLNHPDFDLVSGDATQAYSGNLEKTVREIVYIRPDTFIVIDDLKAAKPLGSSFEWWLQAENNISLYENTKGARIVRDQAVLDAKVQFPENVKGYYSNLFSGPDLIHIPPQGDYTNSQINQRVWFETERVPETKIVTTMDIHRDSEEAQYIKTKLYKDYMKMQFEDGTVALVRTSSKAEEVIAENITFTGSAVVYNDDSIMLVSGTKLIENGNTLLESEKECSAVLGKNEFSVSSYDDNMVMLDKSNQYINGIENITDIKKRNVNDKIGVTITDGNVLPEKKEISDSTAATTENSNKIASSNTQDASVLAEQTKNDDNKVTFKVYKGHYAFILNNKKMAGEPGDYVNLRVTVDGVETGYTFKSYLDADGNAVALGNISLEPAKYKIIGLSEGLNINYLKANDIANLSNELVNMNGTEHYLILEAIPVTKCDTQLFESLNEAKDGSVITEAENYVKNIGGGTRYDTRKFMSGGAGITKMDSPNDEITYKISITEAGNYDFVIAYVAWLKDINTIRTLHIGDFYAIFNCPVTPGWGADPADWQAVRVKSSLYMEPGEYELKLGCLSGSWNIDWLGFAKSSN